MFTFWKPVLVFLLLACSGCANRMFYYPSDRVRTVPDKTVVKVEDVHFNSGDGTPLHGWFLHAKGTPKATVIHFHGNARNVSAHHAFVDWLPAEGYDVFMFDYRGYGRSEGKPEKRGIYQDCIAAFQYVATREDVDPGRLMVFGQSLGGANAIRLMNEDFTRDVRAVAIDSTFYSYRTIASDVIKQVPVLSLFRYPLSFTMVTLDLSPGPVVDRISPRPFLLFHGTADRVIPYSNGEMLYEAAAEPKTFVRIPDGRHLDAFRPEEERYRPILLDFFSAALEEEEPHQKLAFDTDTGQAVDPGDEG